MMKTYCPSWIKPFLIQEGIRYMRLAFQEEKHNEDLCPVRLIFTEGISLQDIHRKAEYSNISALGDYLEADPYPVRLVKVDKFNKWALKSHKPLAKRYREFFKENLRDLQFGNFHNVHTRIPGLDRSRSNSTDQGVRENDLLPLDISTGAFSVRSEKEGQTKNLEG